MKRIGFSSLLILLLLLNGCTALSMLKSDNSIRKELKEGAEDDMKNAVLLKKLNPNDICNPKIPAHYRYICWRYYEIGGDIWTYRSYGKGYSSTGKVLITNNTPIVSEHYTGGSFKYYKDKGRKDLGYKIVKGAMMPKKRDKILYVNKVKTTYRYKKMQQILDEMKKNN